MFLDIRQGIENRLAVSVLGTSYAREDSCIGTDVGRQRGVAYC